MSASSYETGGRAQVEYLRTQRDMGRQISMGYRLLPGRISIGYSSIVSIVAAISIIGMLATRQYEHDKEFASHMTSSLILLTMGLFTLAIPILLPRLTKKSTKPVSVSIGDDGVTVRSEETGHTTGWSSIKSVNADTEYIYILLDKHYAVIPKHAFATAADAEAFQALAVDLRRSQVVRRAAAFDRSTSRAIVRYAVTEKSIGDPFAMMMPIRFPVTAVICTTAIIGGAVAFLTTTIQMAKPGLGLRGYIAPAITFVVVEGIYVLFVLGVFKLIRIALIRPMRAELIGENVVSLESTAFVRAVGDRRIEVPWSKVKKIVETTDTISVTTNLVPRRVDIPKGAFPDRESAQYFVDVARAYWDATCNATTPELPSTPTVWPPPPSNS